MADRQSSDPRDHPPDSHAAKPGASCPICGAPNEDRDRFCSSCVLRLALR
ncbi:MAG: zinc ribbon domain-containing protein [Actinomycetota bacterium]